MEGINMLGCLTLLDDKGALKLDKAYQLREGDNTIGRGIDCNLRLKTKNASLMEVHCLVRVSKNGVAISINKSKGEPVRVNGNQALRAQILKHGDTLSVIDKQFRYLNENVKDKPEEFFTKEKLLLLPVRKSVNILSKTPAEKSTYGSRPPLTPQRNLNLSLRGISSKATSTPKLNQTLNKAVTRKNCFSKTPNFYRTLNSGQVQRSPNPKTPNLGNKAEKDLIVFSPIAQPSSKYLEGEVENSNTLQEHQPNITDNQSLSTSVSLNLNPSEILHESVNSDIDEEVKQSGLDIFKESDRELEESDKDKFITVRSKRSSQQAKISDDSELEEHLENSSASKSSPHHKDYDSPRKSRHTASEIEEAFFLKNRDFSVITTDSSFMEDKEKTMTTIRELSDSSDNNGDSNEDDDVIPETQQAKDDSVFLHENDVTDVGSDSFQTIRHSPRIQRLIKSFATEPRKDTDPSDSFNSPSTRLQKLNESIRRARSTVISVPSSTDDSIQGGVINISDSESKDTSQSESSTHISKSSNRVSNFASGNIWESKETPVNESTQDIVNISGSETGDTSIQSKSSKHISTFDEPTMDAVNISGVAVQDESMKLINIFDESMEDAVDISLQDAIENKPSCVSAFDELTQVDDSINQSSLLRRSVRKTYSKRSSTFDTSSPQAVYVSESGATTQEKSSKRISTFDESTQEPVNISAPEPKRMSTFDESTQDAVNVSPSETTIQNKSKRFSTFDESTQLVQSDNQASLLGSSEMKSSKRVSTFDESTQDAINASEPGATSQNKSSKRISTFDESTQEAVNILASEPKRISTFDESTQDAVNISTSEATIQNKSTKHFSTFDESTQVVQSDNQASLLGSSEMKSSKRVSTFDESTQDAINASEPGATSQNKSSSKRISIFDESTQEAVNIFASEPKRISTFDESTQDAVNISTSEATIQNKSTKHFSTFDESTQVVQSGNQTSLLGSSEKKSLKRVSTFDESTQDAMNAWEPGATTQNKSSKRISTFDESTQDAVNISASEPKRMSTFDESTQDAVNISASEQKPKRMSTFDESTQDAVNISATEPKPKRMSTFDESTQVVDESKNKFQDIESTNEVLQYVIDQKVIDILDDSEVLSPVRPLRKSIRKQASVVDISSNTALQGSTVSETVKRQLSDSSMTDTSLNQSTGAAKSVSSHSFSSFKQNKPETPKAEKLDGTEIIDVENISGVELIENPDVADNATRASVRSSSASLLAERRHSNRASQMFEDVTCTSTPFHKSTARHSNEEEEENSPSLSSSNTLRPSEINETRRSSRVSKQVKHECESITHKSERSELDIEDNEKSLRCTKSLTIAAQKTPKSVSAKSRRSLSPSKNVEESSTSLFKTPVSYKTSRMEEKTADDVDETPKSHLTHSRRSSKSTYNPEVEDITPVTPERLSVSGFSDTFKMPSNTPELIYKVNVERQSTDSITENVEKPKFDSPAKKHQQRSPLDRLSNFEGVKKLMRTPPNSPINDLRNIPNLRSIMSPKQQKSPKNDLTNPVGVRNLLKTPKQQKHPVNDLSDVSGVAQIFNNSSDIENSEDLFTQLTEQQPRRSYRKCNSLSMRKEELDLNYRKTMGDLPDISPRVQEWVEETSPPNMKPFEDDEVLTDEQIRKSRSAKKYTPQTVKGRNSDASYKNATPTAWKNERSEESDESTDKSDFKQNESVRNKSNTEILMVDTSQNLRARKDEDILEFDNSTHEANDDTQSSHHNPDEESLRSSLIADEALPGKKRYKVAFDLPDEETPPVADKKRKVTRSGRIVKATSKLVDVERPRGRRVKAQIAKEASDDIDDENISAKSSLNSGENPEEEETKKSSRDQTESKPKTKYQKNNNIDIDDNRTEVKPTKKRGRKDIAIKATKSTEIEVEQDAVVDVSQPSSRRRNVRKASVDQTQPKEMEIEESPPKPRTRRAKAAAQTTAASVSTKRKAKNVAETTAVTDGASVSTPEPKGRRAKNIAEATAVSDDESVSTPNTKKRRIMNVAEATADTDNESASTFKPTGRKAKNVTEATALTDSASASPTKPKGRKAKNVAEEKSVTDSASASPTRDQTESKPKTKYQKNNNIDIDDNRTEVKPTKKRGRKDIAIKATKSTEIEVEQDAVVDVSQPSSRRRNVRKASVDQTQPKEMEIEESPPKPRTRRAKAAAQTTAASVSTKRKAKNVAETTAVTDSASASTPEPKARKAKNIAETTAVSDDESVSTPNTKKRRVMNVAEATADTDNESASTLKPTGRKAKNVTEAMAVTDSASASSTKPKGLKAKNVAEKKSVTDSASASPTNPKGLKDKKHVVKATADTAFTSTPNQEGNETENLVVELSNIEKTSATLKATRSRRANKMKKIEETFDSPPKGRQPEVKVVKEEEEASIVSPPRTKKRNAKVADGKPQIEKNEQTTTKPRGGKAKNVPEETADVESVTESTTKPNQEEIVKQARRKLRERKAKKD